MPTLYRPGTRKGNRTWVARGTIDGRQREFVTGSANKSDAAKAWHRFETAERERLAAERRADAPLTAETATFADAALLYLQREKRSARTESLVFRLIADELGGMLLARIRNSDIAAAAERLCPGLSAASRNRTVFVPAAAILHAAADEGLCGWLRVRKLREKRPETRALPEQIAEALILAAEGETRSLLVFLFRQGWRISDALRLAWEDIDFVTGTLRYRIAKTDDALTVPMHRDMRECLQSMSRGTGRVFSFRDRFAAYRAIRPVAKKLGVTFTPHQARHTLATALVNRGGELADIMALGGWRDYKSVLRYGRPGGERVREMLERLPKVGEN